MAAFFPDTDSEDELPSGFEERVDPEGRVFFLNHVNQTTQWSHPKSGKTKRVPEKLPHGWEKIVDQDGRITFVDKINNKTTLTDPRLVYAYDIDESEEPKMAQRFSSSTTPSMILAGKDLTGKIAIVTGGNCGIGYETVKALAFHGAKVYVACRDLDRANSAMDILRQEKPSAQIIVMKCDLSSLNSVEEFANEFIQEKEKLHFLICNAGIFGAPHTMTEDGFEQTFQINYLAHIYLIQLLQDTLIASAPSKIILVSSENHRFSLLNSSNISEEYLSPKSANRFVPIMAYNDSKLCMNLINRYLAQMYQNYNVTVHCLHPGNAIYTSLQRNWWFYRLGFFLIRPFTKSEQGAATTIYCAASKELENRSGAYYNNCVECKPSSSVEDEQLINSLWKITQNMLSSRLKKRIS
ncbi:WW domain-containing oxidoreductase-like isoform X2 [Brevipalpus obovatus]|uniref:WW domain-containing oxidoreductase-like isoform X2 n=1 Tax=Brevipalpus obovatus TaxID=246614 RepID=UPI003D9E9537